MMSKISIGLFVWVFFSNIFTTIEQGLSENEINVFEASQSSVINRRLFDTDVPITSIKEIIQLSDLILIYDPPEHHFSPTALGVYVQVVDYPDAKVYYALDGSYPTLSSPYATFRSPYIQIDTPYSFPRERNLTIVGIVVDDVLGGTVRTKEYHLHYFVEGRNRPYSYGFFVPGIETSGYLLRVCIYLNVVH